MGWFLEFGCCAFLVAALAAYLSLYGKSIVFAVVVQGARGIGSLAAPAPSAHARDGPLYPAREIHALPVLPKKTCRLIPVQWPVAL